MKTIVGMAILGVVSLVGAWGSIRSVPRAQEFGLRDWQGRLETSTQIRARAIDIFLRDELDDIELLAGFPSIQSRVAGNRAAANHAREVFEQSAAALHVDHACIMDAAGRVVMKVGGGCGTTGLPPADHAISVRDVNAAPVIVLTAPIRTADGRTVGAIVEHLDPARYFYPLLQQVTGSADVVAYIEAGSPGAPFRFPSGQRASGPVLTASHQLTSAPWRLVVTVDQTVALGPYRREMLRSGLFILLFIATTSFSAWSWWRGEAARSASELLGTRERAVHERRRAEKEIRNLNRLLRLLSSVNELIAREGDRQALLDGVARLTATDGNLVAAWIGFAEPDGRITIAAVAGEAGAALLARNPRWDDSPTGQGVSGRAIREQDSRMMEQADFPAPFAEFAVANGIRSAAASPIRMGGRVVGVITVYDRSPGVFTASVLQILDRVAGNVGLALAAIEGAQRSRHLEEQVRQSQKMEAVGRLAGGVAHDFNNLLTVMFAETGRAMEKLDGHADDELRGSLRFIDEAARQAASLTRQLLAFSRRQVLRPQTIDLRDLVKASASMLRRVLGEDIAIRADVGHDALPVRVDPGQMDQVIMNLSVNARDAMPNGGVLTLAVEPVTLDAGFCARHPECESGPHVKLTIGDTGSGMTPEVMAHLFEPFFTTKELGRGTGLGLSTVYGIVRQSRGCITVNSQPGCGTTFCVYLPRVAAAQERLADAVEAPSRGTETILLTEDDKAVRKVVASSLARCGFTVLQAENADEAMRIGGAHDGPIHLLLTDLIMPGGRGDDLARRFRAERADIPVLFMSGYTDTAKIFGEHQLPRTDFVHKPFTIADLTGRIRRLIDAGGNGNGNGAKR